MRNNSIGVVLVVSLVVAAVAVLGIAHYFDVPLSVGVNVLPSLLLLGVISGALWWTGYLRWTWPLCLGGLWLSFLPVVDYKAGITDDEFPLMPYIEWYGHGIWQAVIFIAIVGAGYAITKWNDNF